MSLILWALPASGFFHTSINSTSMRPAYSALRSLRIGAIALHGMHLSAPRSTSLGSLPGAAAHAAAHETPTMAITILLNEVFIFRINLMVWSLFNNDFRFHH